MTGQGLNPACFLVIFLVLLTTSLAAQTEDASTVELLENFFRDNEQASESDAQHFLENLENYRQRPLNLNKATRAELLDLHLLNDLQVENFFAYRESLGPFLNEYELQAVPGWEPADIRRILAFARVESGLDARNVRLSKGFYQGNNEVLLRWVRPVPSNYPANAEGGPMYFFPASLTDDQVREINARTHVMVELLDEALGRVLAHLDAIGRLADTDIVFTTDHGEMQGDMGFIFKGPWHVDSLMRLPLIWKPAASAGIDAGVVTDPVGQVDLAPTFCAIAGVEPAPWMQGSRLPTFDGEATTDPTFGMNHVFGTTRMGVNPRTSVVDTYTREEEDAFGYLYRHTLLRPRDLMTIGERLAGLPYQ